MFKKFIITCNKATTICDKSQYKEASFLEKTQLYIHLIVCKICTLYSKQNTKISSIIKINMNSYKKKLPCLSLEEKETLKKQLNKFQL
ncbi:hypothetical protein [Tenacibaculum aestuariivivum]|uniref:hypothetical protein n=1 Tax=Tenacibaculum aestuariivivum TaxID=2006131 RepID=UPI003AB90EE6